MDLSPLQPEKAYLSIFVHSAKLIVVKLEQSTKALSPTDLQLDNLIDVNFEQPLNVFFPISLHELKSRFNKLEQFSNAEKSPIITPKIDALLSSATSVIWEVFFIAIKLVHP